MFALRGPVSVLGGALASSAIFFALAHLVAVAFEAPNLVEAGEIKLAQVRIETTAESTRAEQVKREPPILVPGRRPLAFNEVGSVGHQVPIARPIVDRGARERIVLRGTDGDVVPIIRATPHYPPAALAREVEGWVRVQFSVTAIGTVRDAIVVDSEPRSIFDDAALKAVARWRYNPKIEHGEAVERVGLQAVIRFELEK